METKFNLGDWVTVISENIGFQIEEISIGTLSELYSSKGFGYYEANRLELYVESKPKKLLAFMLGSGEIVFNVRENPYEKSPPRAPEYDITYPLESK